MLGDVAVFWIYVTLICSFLHYITYHRQTEYIKIKLNDLIERHVSDMKLFIDGFSESSLQWTDERSEGSASVDSCQLKRLSLLVIVVGRSVWL